jgi:hypothetical protein
MPFGFYHPSLCSGSFSTTRAAPRCFFVSRRQFGLYDEGMVIHCFYRFYQLSLLFY